MTAQRLGTVLTGALPILVVLTVWQMLCSFGYAPPSLLPPGTSSTRYSDCSGGARNHCA